MLVNQTFQIWEPTTFEKFKVTAKANINRGILNGSFNKTNNRGLKMTINFKAPEIKELQPRLLVLGVGGAGKCNK